MGHSIDKSDDGSLHLETIEASKPPGESLKSDIQLDATPWYRTPTLVRLNVYVALLILSATTMGYDGSMANGIQSLDTWVTYFNHPDGTQLGLMNAALFLGLLVAPFAASLSDAVGRRYTIMAGNIILLGGAALQGASKNMATFIVARFVTGLGSQFATLPAPALISEIAYPTHRAKVTGLFQTNFYLGSIASSWITFGSFHLKSDWSWRIPSILQAFFPLIQLVGILFVPESPRWLISKGRHDEARAFFTKYHAAGNDSHPLVEHEMNDITTHLQEEREAAATGWSALWNSKADRKRLFITIFTVFIAQCSGNFIITYYLALVLDRAGVKDSFTKTLINGILQIFNFFAAIGGSLALERLGRRTLWLWSCIGMFVSYILFTACSGVFADTKENAAAVAVIVFIFLFFFHYDIGVTPLTYAYPTEILPFRTRQKGLAVFAVANGCFLIFNSFVNPIALEAIAWKYYIVYVVILAVITVVVYLFFAETKGLPLEEISDVFEGPFLVAALPRQLRRRYHR